MATGCEAGAAPGVPSPRATTLRLGGAGRARGASFGGSFALDLELAGTRDARAPERCVGGFWGALSELPTKPSLPQMPEQLSAITEAGASWADPALS